MIPFARAGEVVTVGPLQMPVPVFVFYHANCMDGFGAAFAAWCALGNAAQYIPVSYGEEFPAIPRGARVYILDFSWPDNARAREALIELEANMDALVVIDHHQTAEEALRDLPFAIFDQTKSGAVLAWEYFRALADPGMCIGEAPALLEYVQDRDLWRWELPRSREINAALAVEPRTFAHWNELMSATDVGLAALENRGFTVRRAHQALVEVLCEGAHRHRLTVHAEGVDHMEMLAVNTPVLQSEVLHELLERHPEERIVAAYFDRNENTRVWSLRSRPGYDCSVLAKRMGGGGHPCAAGFQTTLG